MDDFNNYLPFVKKDGFIVFDNYNDTTKWRGIYFENAHDSTIISYSRISNTQKSVGGGILIENTDLEINNVLINNLISITDVLN